MSLEMMFMAICPESLHIHCRSCRGKKSTGVLWWKSNETSKDPPTFPRRAEVRRLPLLPAVVITASKEDEVDKSRKMFVGEDICG